jgi:hypothetical protein
MGDTVAMALRVLLRRRLLDRRQVVVAGRDGGGTGDVT